MMTKYEGNYLPPPQKEITILSLRGMLSLPHSHSLVSVVADATTWRCASGASASSTSSALPDAPSSSIKRNFRGGAKVWRGVGTLSIHPRRRRHHLSLTSSSSPAALDKNTSNAEWRTVLDAKTYDVLRAGVTEEPYSGDYNHRYWEPGPYRCAGCGLPLYDSSDKFHAQCGWPAFYRTIDPNAVEEFPDPDGERTEIRCAGCGGHLGHVFKGEPFPGSPTNVRHCVNSTALRHEIDTERKAKEEEENRASGW